MMFDRALAPLGITRSQWWVLASFRARTDFRKPNWPTNSRRQGWRGCTDRSPGVIRLRFFAQADPVDRRVKRVFVTKQARGFLEKLRKETDKFNAQIAHGIDRKALEATSDAIAGDEAPSACGCPTGSTLPGNREEDSEEEQASQGEEAA